MQRRIAMVMLTLLMLAPSLWLVLTSDTATPRGQALVGVAAFTSLALVAVAWRMHARGKLLPYRCKTCQSPMISVRPGELRPPPGSTSDHIQWRCTRCGRLE